MLSLKVMEKVGWVPKEYGHPADRQQGNGNLSPTVVWNRILPITQIVCFFFLILRRFSPRTFRKKRRLDNILIFAQWDPCWASNSTHCEITRVLLQAAKFVVFWYSSNRKKIQLYRKYKKPWLYHIKGSVADLRDYRNELFQGKSPFLFLMEWVIPYMWILSFSLLQEVMFCLIYYLNKN